MYASLKKFHYNFVDVLKEGQHNIFIQGYYSFQVLPLQARKSLYFRFA